MLYDFDLTKGSTNPAAEKDAVYTQGINHEC
jgi:hypothetical protein